MKNSIKQYLEQDSKKKVKQVIIFFLIIIASLFFPAPFVIIILEYFPELSMILVPIIMISYSILWLMFIGIRALKIAQIPPIPNTIPITEEELENRLAKFNSLPVKQKIIKHMNGYILSYNKSGKTIERFLEITSYSNLNIKYKLKLIPERKELLFQTVSKGKYTKNKSGIFSFERGSFIQTSVNLLGWNRTIDSPLSIENGEYKAEKKVRGDGIIETSNFLMELCVSSGWTWKPVLFLRLK